MRQNGFARHLIPKGALIRHVPWQKIKVQDPQGPVSSIHFRILGFLDPESSIHFRIQGSQGPTSGTYIFQDYGFLRSHDKYTFQDPKAPRSQNLESPRSHKYTFQDPESPLSHDK